MAFILKAPVSASKGIAMFTHKESPFLDLNAPLLGTEIQTLRQKYVVGMHWGFHSTNTPVVPAVDFHLTNESTARFTSSHVRTLPFNSAMFTPPFFCVEPGIPKHWDILAVTRASKFKNTRQLLNCLRLVYNRRPNTRALVLCQATSNPDPRREDVGLNEHYQRLFDAAERERFKFVLNSGELFPFAREDIAFFLKASKLFTLFTDTEGASKVLKEALLCGVPVVTKRDLKGGGGDYLDQNNSRRFETTEEGARAMLDILNDPPTFDAELLAHEVSEVYTVPRFKAALTKLFQELGLPFEGDIDQVDLGRKLPSHAPNMLPPLLREGITYDLNSARAMLLYLRMINGSVPVDQLSLTATETYTLKAWSSYQSQRKRLAKSKRRAERLVTRLFR